MSDENSEPTEFEIVPPSALEAQERASIDVQIATAKRYPRDLATVKKELLSMATLDKETAASCFYTLRRKDRNEPTGFKIIQGPSVRLAEFAVNAFGHIHAMTRQIANDGKEVTTQAVCHDMQKNVRIGMEVKRRITTKEGNTFSQDMQIVTSNAAQSIALRNSIFRVIPLALVKPAYEAAKKVAVGDAATLASNREAVVKRLEELGAKRDRIFAALEIKGIESIDLEKLEILIGTGTAIKDGDTTIDEAFPPIIAESRVGGAAKSVTEAAQAEKAAKKPPEPEMPTETGDQQRQAVVGNDEGKVPTAAPKKDTAAGGESAPPASGPTAKELVAGIMKKARENGIGKAVLTANLIEMQMIPADQTIDTVDAKLASSIDDAWTEILDRIKNPEA